MTSPNRQSPTLPRIEHPVKLMSKMHRQKFLSKNFKSLESLLATTFVWKVAVIWVMPLITLQKRFFEARSEMARMQSNAPAVGRILRKGVRKSKLSNRNVIVES